MSLANKITLTRGALIAPVVVAVAIDQRVAAFLLFSVACLGDVIDGFVARSRHEVTRWGKILDPAVDKALYLAVIGTLAMYRELSPLTAALFALPHVGLLVGGVVLHQRAQTVQSARAPGKLASVATYISTALLLLNVPDAVVGLYVAMALTYIAGMDYLRSAWDSHGTSS